MLNEFNEEGYYDDLIKNHGCTIPELLTGNSGNVGDIGELLIIAANEIKRLEKFDVRINSPEASKIKWH